MTEQRRLAAILVADVAGYSRLMGRDESGTLAALKAVRQEVVDPAIAMHGGRIVKTTGDGLLLEFPSVVCEPAPGRPTIAGKVRDYPRSFGGVSPLPRDVCPVRRVRSRSVRGRWLFPSRARHGPPWP